jgi:hypothetical protein
MSIGSAAIVVVLAAAACDSSSSSGDAAPSTTQKSGAAKIVSFDVPATVQCAANTPSTTFAVSYDVSGAKRQELLVDGRVEPGTNAASATLSSVPVHCDAVPHTVVIVAYDANNRRTAMQKILKTLAPS